MISKTFRIARVIVLASLALSSAAWAATCSNASLSGTYGFLHDGTDSNGTPLTAAVSQVTFDATTGTFAGETIASHDWCNCHQFSRRSVRNRLELHRHRYTHGRQPLLHCGYVNRFLGASPFFARIRREAGLPDLHQCRS